MLTWFLFPLLTLQARERENFDSGWQYHLGDIEMKLPMGWSENREANPFEIGYDTSNWADVDLPHDWMIEQERDPNEAGFNSFFPDGIAWYRKDFILPKEDEGKHIELQFDGIYRTASVWVNGYLLGCQYDGYTSFYHDISDLVVPGETNCVVVKADASGDPISRWYSGGGIYRHVWLTKTSDLHVKNWGTFIRTEFASSSKAEVAIETEIENYGDEVECVVETIIYDAENVKVAKKNVGLSLKQLRSGKVEQAFRIKKPNLWSTMRPYLYKAVSIVKVNDEIVDEYESTFGIRTIEFDANNGFFLNGESLKMKGVCLHHAAGSFGAAVPIEVWERRLLKLKDIGCNAIRTAHNPMAPEFMDLCDRMGFLVMDEFVDKWSYWAKMINPTFRDEWKKNFENTIRRDRNHPSVVIWSVGNENFKVGSSHQNQGLRELVSFVHDLDATRPVVSGMERGPDEPVEEKIAGILKSCSYMDLIAMNYGEQWCDEIHQAAPGKPYVSTESYRYFNSEEETRHALIESSPWIDVINNDSNIGMFIWVGINYLGEVGNNGYPRNGSTSGLLDMSGMRKPESYLYEAFWSEKPMVHIAVYEDEIGKFEGMNNWRWPKINGQWRGQTGENKNLVTYTNCEVVELYLNNRLIGTRKLEDHTNWIINWADIAYESGTLKAIGKNDGEVVCEYVMRTPETASRMVLSADKDIVKAGDIIHVEVRLEDKNGTLITHETPDVSFSIEGGEILALENGDPMYAGSFSNRKSRSFYNGTILCVLRIQDPDNVHLTAISADLQTATVEF